jgi:hypothetical protein
VAPAGGGAGGAGGGKEAGMGVVAGAGEVVMVARAPSDECPDVLTSCTFVLSCVGGERAALGGGVDRWSILC